MNVVCVLTVCPYDFYFFKSHLQSRKYVFLSSVLHKINSFFAGFLNDNFLFIYYFL